MQPAAIGIVAFVVTAILTPVVIVVARRMNIVDRPGALKPQSSPVPYLGGVAAIGGASVGALAGRPVTLVPLAAATVLGVADDRFDLPAVARLAAQLAIGGIILVMVPVRTSLLLATIAILVMTVIVVNGVNLLDGLDMLASGVVLVAAIGMAVLIGGWGRDLATGLAGALVGFLLYNRPPAKVYLGDGGSYLLGTALVVLVAAAWAPGVPSQRGLAALALVAVPCAEVAFAVLRRARAHQSLLHGDRGHPYDRLVRRGWPAPAASLAYIAAEVVVGAAAIAAALLGSPQAVIAVDVAVALLLVACAGLTGALRPDQDALA
jgi:UDP-GlcNAc:undecaprenyl-phosphate/decaprenyl-phosphate GlcNAc-1-phosphate transferase